MEITNKNVFITGSTRGIGLAIAHHFAANGANLVLNGRSDITSELIGEFDQYDVQVVGVSGDVSDADDAKRMIQEATDALGSVDVLINNAGITADKLVLKMTADDFERVLKINLTGAFNMTQAVLKPMTKARQGAIINMTSVCIEEFNSCARFSGSYPKPECLHRWNEFGHCFTTQSGT